MARPQLINRDSVLQAALAVAGEHGIDGLTMTGVARRLGVSTMALYRHVADKADLLDGLVERLLDEVPPADAKLPPRQQLTAYANAIRDTAHQHPAVFPLLLARPARTTRARERRDGVVRLLEQLGATNARARRTERLISTMILGYATSEAAGRFANHSRRVRDADWAALGDVIGAMIDAAARY